MEVSERLIAFREFRDTGFNWFSLNTDESKYYAQLEYDLLEDAADTLNLINFEFKDENYTANDLFTLAMFNYIQTFTNFLCGKLIVGINYRSFPEVQKEAMKSNNQHLLQDLMVLRKLSNLRIEFQPIGKKFDNWGIHIYQQSY